MWFLLNVLADSLFDVTAIHFFLGTNDKKYKDEEDNDDGPDLTSIKHQMQINKKKGSRQSLLDKAKSSIKRVW